MKARKSAGKRKWVDPDDAPELTKEWFETADLYKGEKLIRRGRPRSAAPKTAVSLRLDADVLEYYKSAGAGWQSRINADLRKAAKLKQRA
ncbi:MAG: BrnA antitoxin family protein [Alphaproteobacteria bacterium]|nr:BrnA antitoxin family protein [Alphaproteobacteria bacterium]